MDQFAVILVTVASARLAFALIALGVVVRVSTLSVHSLWLDEAFSVLTVRAHSAAEIWSPGIDPIHPPLFYLILQRSLALVGVSEFGARLPSALTSIANIGLIWWLGRRLFPTRGVGLMAGVLLAVAPIDLWYAQEARMYELVTMAGLVLAIGVVSESWWARGLVVLGLTGGLYLDHTMWPLAIVVLVMGGTWMAHTARRASQLGTVVAGVLLALMLSRQVWAQALVAYGELDNVSLFKNLSARFGLGSVTGASLLPMMLAFAAVTLCGVLLAAMALGRREWRGWLPSAIVVGFTVATALVIVPRAYSLKQVLVCAWPYGVLLTAWALDEVRALDPRRARMLAGASAGLSLVACAFTFMTPRADWRGVSAHFINHASPYTRVILDPPYNGQPWSFYRQPGGAAVVQTDGNDTGLLERLATAGSDLCLVAERFGAAPPTSKTEAWLDQHVPLTSTTRFSRLEVRCYRAPATLPSGE